MGKNMAPGHGGMIMVKKKYNGDYYKGKKDGQWFEWSSDGNLIVSGSYKGGKRWDGIFKGTKYISGEKQNL